MDGKKRATLAKYDFFWGGGIFITCGGGDSARGATKFDAPTYSICLPPQPDYAPGLEIIALFSRGIFAMRLKVCSYLI